MAVIVDVISSPALGEPDPLIVVPIVSFPVELIFIWLLFEAKDANEGLPSSEL